jgi:hypothetical protein
MIGNIIGAYLTIIATDKTTWLNLPQSDILLYWTVKNPDLINGIRENFFAEIRINKINIYDTGPGRKKLRSSIIRV